MRGFRRDWRPLPPLLAIGLLALAGCGGGGGTTTTAPPPPNSGQAGSHGQLPTGDGQGGVRLQKIGDFDQPVYVTQPPGDHRDLYVVQRTGRIEVVRNGEPVSRPFLDLSNEITSSGSEQGLLSLAFAPDYRKSGLLYVDYTDTAGDTRVVEYRRSSSDPLVADPQSAREVLSVDQPYTNHNGGLVVFGPGEAPRGRRGGQAPDLLYVGLGDGGSEGDPQRRGQDLSSLLGKILRIDPRPSGEAPGGRRGGRDPGRPYSVPASNPFVGRSGARPEIYSYGLRNPWRFSFDSATGALAIGDVGQDRWEEVDLVARGKGLGANFGWSAYEGFDRFNDDQQAPNAVPPVFVYSHDVGCSITGGYVVRDRTLPSLYGRYLYGDYCGGQLRSFTAVPGLRVTDDRGLGLQVPQLSSFGEDGAGHVYATSLQGPVYRLVADPG
ncbi:MAG: PQQ-dependent sugar dehydrogenase [Actinobacteria bacterium]|nr:MAG: PQQ-dependent sugar dehydrogenase [Actinomycetota bacterium]